MSFDLKLKRLSGRNWPDVASAWMQQVPQLVFDDGPGQRPDEDLCDFHALGEVTSTIKPDGELRYELAGFRSAVLHEGIFLTHKAANVLVASHNQVVKGLPTWSVSTAYQSAFFSMEAMLRILGVAIIRANNKNIVVDVWPEVEKGSSNKTKRLYKLGMETQWVCYAHVDHFHRWAILKKVLRTLDNSPISNELINTLVSLDDKDFARQRNNLHYSNTWLFPDLHAYCSAISYCKFSQEKALIEYLDPIDQNFTVVLASFLLSANAALLAFLGQTSSLIKEEWKLLDGACSNARMRLRHEYEKAMSCSMI